MRAEGGVGEAGVGLISHQEGVLVLQDHCFEWLPLPLGVFSTVPGAWGWSGSGVGADPAREALGSGEAREERADERERGAFRG